MRSVKSTPKAAQKQREIAAREATGMRKGLIPMRIPVNLLFAAGRERLDSAIVEGSSLATLLPGSTHGQ